MSDGLYAENKIERVIFIIFFLSKFSFAWLIFLLIIILNDMLYISLFSFQYIILLFFRDFFSMLFDASYNFYFVFAI